jgi:uncharacterized protein YbjT (DUF2867 family)
LGVPNVTPYPNRILSHPRLAHTNVRRCAARLRGHEGKIYSLRGPVEMNHTEIAAAMSEVLGAKIEYAPISIEEFKEKMEQLYKFPPFLVQHLVEVAQLAM